MATMTTKNIFEIATLTLKPNTSIIHGHNAAFNSLTSLIPTTPGLKKAFTASQYEDDRKLHFVVHWDCIESHQKLTAAPDYRSAVLDKIDLFSTHDSLKIYHISLSPNNTKVFTAPAIEYAILHVLPELTYQTFEQIWETFVEKLVMVRGYISHATGWSIECPKDFVTFVAWESVDAHMAFRRSEGYDEVCRGLGEGVVGVEMVYLRGGEGEDGPA